MLKVCHNEYICLCCRRHLLRFHMQAPLGYQVHLVSTVEFIFGDEDSVMNKLTEVGFGDK